MKSPKTLFPFRQGLKKVGDQAEADGVENRHLPVLVGRDDHLAVLHAGEVLHRTDGSPKLGPGMNVWIEPATYGSSDPAYERRARGAGSRPSGLTTSKATTAKSTIASR